MKEPDWSRVPATVPPAIRALLQGCLVKNRKDRVGDIASALFALRHLASLDSASREAAVAPVTLARPRLTRALPLATGVALGAVLAGVAAWRVTPPAPLAGIMIRSTIMPPQNTVFDFNVVTGPAVISPNGRMLAFVVRSPDGRTQLWVRSLDSLTARAIEGTNLARFPFWSSDSLSLGFIARETIMRVAVAGGPPVPVVDAIFVRGASWGRNGYIVFDSANEVISAIPAAGGMAQPVTARHQASQEGAHKSPSFLPDGRHFLYWVAGLNQVRVGSIDAETSQVVTNAASNAIYAEGHILFLRQGTLMAQPFDVRRLRVSGEAVPVTDGVQMLVGEPRGVFSASDDGTLVYQGGGANAAFSLAWIGRTGTPLTTVGEVGDAQGVFLSL